MSYRSLNSDPPQTFFNTGTFALRGICSSGGEMTIQFITNADHAALGATLGNPTIASDSPDGNASTNTTTFTYTDPDFRTGTVGNLNKISSDLGQVAYSSPGTGGGATGQNVTMTFVANDQSAKKSPNDGTNGPGSPEPPTGSAPFGGTTQVACQLDGNAIIS